MFKRWHSLPWMRRFWIVLGGIFLLILIYLYGIENIRGTLALRKAKLRAEKQGLSMDIGKRMAPDRGEGANFADCRDVVGKLPGFDSLQPGFRGMFVHHDNYEITDNPYPWRTGTGREFAASVSPVASSEVAAASQILGWLETHADELAAIEKSSLATRCDFEYDWTQNIREVRLFSPSSIYRWFGLRAYCHVVAGESDSAVADIETLFRVAGFTNGKPLWFHAGSYQRLAETTCDVVWEGLNAGRFSVEEIDRCIAAISESGFRGFLVRTLINEEAWALRYAEQKYFSMRARAAHESSYPPNYWPESLIASSDWDDELLERAEHLTYVALPSGWFKQSQRVKFSKLVDLGITDPSVLEMYRFSEKGLRRDSIYSLVWKGSEFSGSYRDIAAVMINAETELELALFALRVERERLRTGDYSHFETEENRPTDPWSEKPMKYFIDSNDRPVLYSIGQDGLDGSGIPLDRSGNGDLVWQYENPAELP